MNNLLQKSKLYLKRNSSTILTCVGAIGVVGTAVMTAKATPKALMLLEEAEKEKGEKLSKVEVVKVAGPVYIPAALVGASTIACVFGANILNKRKQAALMSAYALLENSYKEYKDKVKEMLGEETEKDILDEVVKDKLKEEDISEEDDGLELFFDEFSGRYFRTTKDKVRQAEYSINRTLVMRDYAYLNEFYEELGLEEIESGYELGWSVGSNLACYWQPWIDFSNEKITTDDGLECTIIRMWEEPVLDFTDYS